MSKSVDLFFLSKDEKYKAKLSLLKNESKGESLSAKFGGKGKAASIQELDPESVGFWRASGDKRKPSRTGLMLIILFCLVQGKTPREFAKSKTFLKVLAVVHDCGPKVQFFGFGRVCQEIAKESGFKWDTTYNSPTYNPDIAWNQVVYQVAAKGFLKRVGHGTVQYSGKAFPAKG